MDDRNPQRGGQESTRASSDDEDIRYLLDVQQTISDIEEGRKEPNDDTELDVHRKMYKDRFRKAFLDDDILNIEVNEQADHSVKVTTDRFEAVGKRGRDDGEVRVTFTAVEHPEEDLTYKDVNGAVCERMTDAYRDFNE